MRPWKSFVGSVSVVTLLTAGAFAAGSDVMPFSHASGSIPPGVVLEEAPVADGDAFPVDPADEVADDTTTTTDTDTPDAGTPDAGTPDTDTAADSDSADAGDASPPVVVVERPAEPSPVPTALPAPVDVDEVPPAVPAEDDAPAVCAVAAESDCGPAEADPAAEATFESRVQRCQDWWNRLADRLDAGGRDRWAERARRVAERCEAIALRWQERRDRKVKGDHNCDGHPDNGWHNKERPVCPTPSAPADRPARGPRVDKGDRPESAPGQVRKNR